MPLFHHMFILKGICKNSGTYSIGWTKRTFSPLHVRNTYFWSPLLFPSFFFVHFFYIWLIWIALLGTSSWTWHLVSICKNESQVCLRTKGHLTYPLTFLTGTLQVRAEKAVNNHNKLHPYTSVENIQQHPFFLGLFFCPSF